MSKVLVLGRGQMGSAIKWAMEKLGHDVWTIDSEGGSAESHLAQKVDRPCDYNGYVSKDARCLPTVLTAVTPHIVISALPYTVNGYAATICIDRGIKYCDLGGHVDTSRRINKYAYDHGQCVFTDLGLAPGLVNIMAHAVWTKEALALPVDKAVDEVRMYCGGIPGHPNVNMLKYIPTWSLEGLYNEYTDLCNIIADGNRVTARALGGTEKVVVEGIELEAFYTSGAATRSLDYFFSKGVKRFSYKTMRYPGHRNMVDQLIRNLGKAGFINFVEKMCQKPSGTLGTDLVLVKAEAISHRKEFSPIKSKTEITLTIPYDNINNMTAMQRGTAFPCAAVADFMLDNMQHANRPLHYADIPIHSIFETLDTLDLTI